ncbi:class B sortase [Acutalibacter sp. 1XD8-33]|uniref:class B sortase n=1 Tax=Acutalibacter sp. 1XD8-33 TaxID=2320081 RepID=UPI0011C45C61|nr:class B sortase [Acutalibacter sp. 1XD8-33]
MEPSPAPSATTSPAEDAPGAEAKEDVPSGMDLSPLQEVNPDVVGWIAIPGILSYPLLQGGDNARYLTHAWNGKENAAEAVFLDCRTDAFLGDFNILIYGDRMRNGAMFGSLKHYKDIDFWRENPSVYLANEDSTRRYNIYAAYETGLTAATYQREFSSPEEKQEFIRYGLERSVIDTGVTPTAEDTIITLSTCSGGDRNTRWIVQAVSSPAN